MGVERHTRCQRGLKRHEKRRIIKPENEKEGKLETGMGKSS